MALLQRVDSQMTLVNVYRQTGAIAVLYELLRDRPAESRISHKFMPRLREHAKFVRSHPYRFWYLIRNDNRKFVGDIHVTWLNEIGVFIHSTYRGAGYGSEALQLFMKRHKPMPAIPAKRVARWLANIAPDNVIGKEFFKGHGFSQVQETYAR